MASKRITGIVLAVLITAGFYAFFASPNAFSQSSKENTKSIYEKANEHFDAQNWQDAYALYKRLTTQYAKDYFVKSKIKEIEEKLKKCEQTLGIVTDIARIFKGKPKLDKKPNGTNILKLFYDFSDEEQLDDFVSRSIDAKIVNQTLQMKDLGSYFFVNLKDAIFETELLIEADVTVIPPTDAEASMAIFYDKENETGYMFALRYRQSADPDLAGVMYNCIMVMNGPDRYKTRPLALVGKPKIEPGKPYHIKIYTKANQLSFYINNDLVKTVTDKTTTQGLIRFGGYSGCVQYDNIKIEGIVNPSWLDKAFSSATTEVLAEKERADDSPLKDLVIEVKMDLSAEADVLLAKIPKDAVESYKKAKAEMLKLPNLNSRTIRWRDLLKPTKSALKLFDDVIKYAPDFAAAYYQRAVCAARLDETQNAMDNLNKAVEKYPNFYEAYYERGNAYLELSKYEEALADYEKCVSLQSDYSKGFCGRGYACFILNERDKAMADLDKALELDSSNSKARKYKEILQHVLKGPLWPIVYEKDTDNYKIKTDISQDKCDLYGAQLETLRKYYADVFAVKDKSSRKKQVYIFNTQEGYQTYAEFSTKDSAEYTLGYYHPHYQELLVFERATKEAQVLHVLYHEGFHMFIDAVLPAIPIWLNEGFAEYFNGTELSGGQGKWAITKVGLPIDRLEDIQKYIELNGMVSFEQIMNETQEEFYGEEVGERYAQAWSMVHFFIHYQQGVYKSTLIDYIKALKAGKSRLQAFEDTFKKKDLIKMQKEWMAYT
ncbi:MAG TPA: tetratricopeptide repeat protein, partial [Planctomycetota bacterium]|nr:tetratricopeptide repeat protein [Planctomycetota bacterium]